MDNIDFWQNASSLRKSDSDNKVLEHWENVVTQLLETIDFNSAEELLKSIENEHNAPIL